MSQLDVLLLLICLACASATPKVTVPVFSSFEATLPLPVTANPFDVSSFVCKIFCNGEHIATHNGFLFQNYTSSLVDGSEQDVPVGSAVLMFRHSPCKEGDYLMELFVAGDKKSEVGFTAVDFHDSEGFVRIGANKQHFVRDSGKSIFLVGENLAW